MHSFWSEKGEAVVEHTQEATVHSLLTAIDNIELTCRMSYNLNLKLLKRT